MNGTPRALNRIILTLIGLLLIIAGAGVLTLAAVPAAASWWQDYAQRQLDWLLGVEDHTRLLLTSQSWIWLAVAAVFLIVVIGMVTWIGNQGKGRASTLLDYQGNPDDDGAAGAVRLSCAVAEQALKSALQERTDLVGVTVASYDFRKQTAIKIRVLPRQGVSPHVVASDITDLVAALDKLLGFEVPILLSIGSGARSRFTKAERVR
ncbi:hypothetical protein [Arthrobacter psychrochitiniphilus]|uniref:Alkaline shock response membrane anchor protein AmaP n=1 Tax=Arthrobacter psychrochitiniphilus TaxID=291045 RepID=A0A2V3DU85_9MICC|nr:hypothetical protein [Arthrobacter psychrochitiniphilus]NYG19014.1 hypothetical protein [Arthrobacter psychrochitiniphilus]PXA66001.1 hypothetical protein CVS29_08385 [Arthrobacter psychrochitiniphilus]